MTRVGFGASHERRAPSALLAPAKRADLAGFASVSCSGHIGVDYLSSLGVTCTWLMALQPSPLGYAHHWLGLQDSEAPTPPRCRYGRRPERTTFGGTTCTTW